MSEWDLDDGLEDAGACFFSSCRRCRTGASPLRVADPTLHQSCHRHAAGFWCPFPGGVSGGV
jgi:hypothetical protein